MLYEESLVKLGRCVNGWEDYFMAVCRDCPRRCGVERPDSFQTAGKMGICSMPFAPVVARAALHFGEEPCISGSRGSGTIFFSGCSLRCVFCQNYRISTENFGQEGSVFRLREIYDELIAQGAHNINLVNPTHFVRAIAQSLKESLPVPVLSAVVILPYVSLVHCGILGNAYSLSVRKLRSKSALIRQG